jgi:hypothetical protein
MTYIPFRGLVCGYTCGIPRCVLSQGSRVSRCESGRLIMDRYLILLGVGKKISLSLPARVELDPVRGMARTYGTACARTENCSRSIHVTVFWRRTRTQKTDYGSGPLWTVRTGVVGHAVGTLAGPQRRGQECQETTRNKRERERRRREGTHTCDLEYDVILD